MAPVMSLPCLSRLKIHECVDIGTPVKRKAPDGDHGEGADAEPSERLPASHIYVKDIDWTAMFNATTDENPIRLSFSVEVPNSDSIAWEMTFDVHSARYIDLMTTNKDDICARLHRQSEGYLDVASLFYNVREDTHTECQISPQDSGMGAAVLQVFDGIACQMQHKLKLIDAASFNPNTASPNQLPLAQLDFYDTELSKELSLVRGYGYYEGKGFCPLILAKNVTTNQRAMMAARELDLEWTHMIVTTPLGELASQIRSFHRIAAEKPHIVSFTTRLYSESRCANAAEHAEQMCTWLDQKDWTQNGGESYKRTSLREIALGTEDSSSSTHGWSMESKETVLVRWMEELWERTIELDGEYVAYPGDKLVKSYWLDTNGAHCSLICKPNSDTPGGLPLLALEPVRQDMIASKCLFNAKGLVCPAHWPLVGTD